MEEGNQSASEKPWQRSRSHAWAAYRIWGRHGAWTSAAAVLLGGRVASGAREMTSAPLLPPCRRFFVMPFLMGTSLSVQEADLVASVLTAVAFLIGGVAKACRRLGSLARLFSGAARACCLSEAGPLGARKPRACPLRRRSWAPPHGPARPMSNRHRGWHIYGGPDRQAESHGHRVDGRRHLHHGRRCCCGGAVVHVACRSAAPARTAVVGGGGLHSWHLRECPWDGKMGMLCWCHTGRTWLACWLAGLLACWTSACFVKAMQSGMAAQAVPPGGLLTWLRPRRRWHGPPSLPPPSYSLASAQRLPSSHL
jgi:hypothetical protein